MGGAVIRETGPGLNPQMAEVRTLTGKSGIVRTLADAERAHITTTLRESNWVVGGRNGAAARLGLPRTSLIARMRKLGISRDAVQSSEVQALPGVATAGSMYKDHGDYGAYAGLNDDGPA